MIRATLVFYLATLIPPVMKDCRSASILTDDSGPNEGPLWVSKLFGGWA